MTEHATKGKPEKAHEERNTRRTVIGTVTSAGMMKTIVVQVDRIVKHPVFKKYVRKTSVFKAHDAEGVAKKGDKVEIIECRPISKTKHFRLIRVVHKSKTASAPEFVQEA
jgi:small subunit ribosomal protein S17